MPEELVFYYPPEDKDIRANIKRWLIENGGQLPFQDLERRLQQRFNFFSKSVHTRAEIEENPVLRDNVNRAYRLKDGIVYYTSG